MNNKLIGVFDSGLGGLTAVRSINDIMPNEGIVYFGDTLRVPYGSRSESAIIKFVTDDVNFLRSFDVKLIIAACGTASAVALPVIADNFDIPIFGVLTSSVKRAVAASKNGHIGVLGTHATTKSGAYEREILKLRSDAKVIKAACPMFVPLVENGYIDGGKTDVVEIFAREYLDILIKEEVDTVILGCTHYPLIRNTISDIMGRDVCLIDAGEAASRDAYDYLRQTGQLCDRPQKSRYFVSDDEERFESVGSMILGRQIQNKIERVDLF